MPAPAKRRRFDSIEETDQQLVARVVREICHNAVEEQDEYEVNEWVDEWLAKNTIQMNSQRKRGFRKRVRDILNNTDNSSVTLSEWCYKQGFRLQVPITMLINQPQPLLFHRNEDFSDFVSCGGMERQHPGAPQPVAFYDRATLSFDVDAMASYNKASSVPPQPPISAVIQASKVLYQLNPDRNYLDGSSIFESWRMRQMSDINFIRRSIAVSVGYVAHTILHVSPKIRLALPVRIRAGEFPPVRQLDKYVAEDWAILITFDSDSDSDSNDGTVTTLLPMQMEMTGGVTRPFSKPNAATKTLSWVEEPMHEAVLDSFRTRPRMQCLDVSQAPRTEIVSRQVNKPVSLLAL